MPYVTSYDAKDTVVVIDGIYITGFGEDMVSAEKDEDFFSSSVGAQGDVVNSEINNDLGTVNVTVQRTSPSKAFLFSLAKRKEPFPLWIINKKLGERKGGTMARMVSYPELADAAEVEDIEFGFKVFDYTVESV